MKPTGALWSGSGIVFVTRGSLEPEVGFWAPWAQWDGDVSDLLSPRIKREKTGQAFSCRKIHMEDFLSLCWFEATEVLSAFKRIRRLVPNQSHLKASLI